VSIVTAPSFVSISGGMLNIYSTNIADIMEHDVIIKLEDTYPLSTSYTFIVAILNRGPELTATIENQTVSFNSALIYNLPVRDPENQPLDLRINAIKILQDFTTFSSNSI
jgi:hypothetical protein